MCVCMCVCVHTYNMYVCLCMNTPANLFIQRALGRFNICKNVFVPYIEEF